MDKHAKGGHYIKGAWATPSMTLHNQLQRFVRCCEWLTSCVKNNNSSSNKSGMWLKLKSFSPLLFHTYLVLVPAFIYNMLVQTMLNAMTFTIYRLAKRHKSVNYWGKWNISTWAKQ